MKTPSVCVLLLFVILSHGLVTAIPNGWKITGAHQIQDDWLEARERVTIDVPLPPDTILTLATRLSSTRQPLSCHIQGTPGKSLEWLVQASDAEYRIGLIGKEVLPLPDACLDIVMRMHGETLFQDQYFIRPHPHWYKGEDRKRILAEWQKLPCASGHEVTLCIETHGDEVSLWVDDRFVGKAAIPGCTNMQMTLSPGNAMRAATVMSRSAWRNTYLPVGLRGYRRPGKLVITQMSVPRGRMQVIGRVPFDVSHAGNEIDVGHSRWLAEKTGPEEFTDNYYTRTSFDSRPEDILLAIPADDYSFAHVLCVVDPHPAKTPVLTLRLSRWLKDYYDSGGRGDGIADSSARIEKTGGKWPPGCAQVGIVHAKTAHGAMELPLLRVDLPLRCGHIQDILEEKGIFYGRSTQYLDLELTKELHLVQTVNHGAFSLKPLGKQSGVQVLALTLERSPVKVRVRSVRPGNVFHASEQPSLTIEMENRIRKEFDGTLSWCVTDYYGRSNTRSRRVKVPVAGPQTPHRQRIDVQQPQFGWFKVELLLRDRAGRRVWEHAARFAILPTDTRKAGRESPFGIWWFRHGHVGTDSIEEIAPLLQRLGFRHVCPAGLGAKPTGEELARYGLSISMYPDFVRSGERGPQMLDTAVTEHPKVGWALIFHECGFGENIIFPPEFLGQHPPKLTEAQQKQFTEWWDKAVAYSRYCREKYPDVKLILGNSSLPFAVEFMRQGYPRELVDALGDEDLGQSIMPEAPPAAFKSVFWLKEYARLYKYDAPVTSCYEWRARSTNPGNLTELEQAQLYSRDVLQGLAFGMPHINVGLLHDVGDAYYYSRWGATGVCQRYPLLYPKISYVALATLTRELDQAVFRRYLNTGSPTLFAMEFAKDNTFVYALWLPRGERKVRVFFERDATFTVTDMNGNSETFRTRSAVAEISVGASPSYLKTITPISGMKAGPTQCEPPPQKRTVVDPLTDLAHWEVIAEPDVKLDTCHFDFPRHAGRIVAKVKPDEQKRQALELELQPQPDVPWPVARYVKLEQKDKGKPTPGQPTSVGVWVKGNSCWGRVFFELQDAKGEQFLSIGAPCGGWSVGDWVCRTFINFDGWNYISVRLPFWYASGFYGPPEHNWTYNGGDGIVDYPICFTQLIVELRDRVVHLTDAVNVPERCIRLKDLSVGYD